METPPSKRPKEFLFEWEGKDRNGRAIRGETRALGENQLLVSLRRQGIAPSKVSRRRWPSLTTIRRKDIAVFTRQFATMMKSGVPLLQTFDIVARGHPNPGVTRLLVDIRSKVESGSSLSGAFRMHPHHFDNLYCNLVEAGEVGGILDDILERLAVHMEKTENIKSKVRSAMMYPLAVVVVALVVVAMIMVFVIPSFKEVFSSFGADLPAPTLFVIALSEFFIDYGWPIPLVLAAALYVAFSAARRHLRVQALLDSLLLKAPVFGALAQKAIVARWCRTLSTLFSAGVPLVEALTSVGAASGNAVYAAATVNIQQEVSKGTSLTTAMTHANLFPSMVVQMCAIGEESGSVDHMLGKAADFLETEVDDMVAGLSSLLEPIIIVLLGTVVGGIVVSMYLPVFNLGQVI